MELTHKHFCAIIFDNFRRGFSKQQCFDELNSLYSDETSMYSTLKSWFNESDRGLCLVQGIFRTGHSKSGFVPENIDVVRELIK